jgi:hypothetical protein
VHGGEGPGARDGGARRARGYVGQELRGDDWKTEKNKVSHGGSPELEKERWRRDQTDMDSWKGIHDGVEKIEMNLEVKAKFAGDEKRGRKSSPNLRRNASCK